MTFLRLVNPGLRDIFRLGVRQVYAYRMWMYLGVIQVFFQLALVRAVWQAVYGNRSAVDGIPIETMIAYLTVVGLINFMIYPSIADEIQRRIDQGQVAIDMVRPVGFVGHMLAINFGNAAGRWLGLVIVIPGLMLIGSLALPTVEVLVLFLISFALGLTVSTLISLLVGLSGFWLINIGGMRAMVFLVGNFLAGSMVPLWFMPGPLRTVVEWLPFQAITFLPASIYIGEVQGAELVRVLGIQMVWVVVLCTASAATWNRAQRRLVIQGG